MKRVEKSHLPVLALSHPGMRGKNNEDRYGVSAFRMEDSAQTPAVLAVLSDGIGGHRAGEVAAEMVVDYISMVIAEKGDRLPPMQALETAILAASQAIFEQSRANHNQEGMGATCACVYIMGSRLYTAAVGDSRIYLLRDGSLHQLTTDHTWVQEALAQGKIKPDQIQGHPNAHVIRRFLGSPQPPEVDFRLRLDSTENDEAAVANQGLPLHKGDLLFLCSDGLTDLVKDEEIKQALLTQPWESAAQGLIDLANQRGGHDNITLILLKIPAGVDEKPFSSRRWFQFGCLSFILVIALAAVFALGASNLWVERTATPTAAVNAVPGLTLPPPGEQTATAATMVLTPASTQPAGSTSPVVTITVAETFLPPGEATLTPWPTNTRSP